MPNLGTDPNGRPIIGVGIRLRKAGDGLSEAAEVDPVIALDVYQGDTGYLLIKWQCVDVQWPVEDRKHPADGGVKRIPILDASTATLVEEEFALSRIAEQEERNERYRAEQAGQHQLGDGLVLSEEHDRGEHADGLVDHCPKCAEEAAKAVAEESDA